LGDPHCLREIAITGQEERCVVRMTLREAHKVKNDQAIDTFLLDLVSERVVLLELGHVHATGFERGLDGYMPFGRMCAQVTKAELDPGAARNGIKIPSLPHEAGVVRFEGTVVPVCTQQGSAFLAGQLAKNGNAAGRIHKGVTMSIS
jgi:hypothetical protein